MSSLKELSQRLVELKTEFLKQGEQLFKVASAEIFAQHPNLTSFGWEQWSPYFNDGDPCLFHVQDSTVRLNEINPELDDEDEGNGLTKTETDNARDAVTALILLPPEEIMQGLFGDNAAITVHRDGRIEQGYAEHD